jgi:hypothetical protein
MATFFEQLQFPLRTRTAFLGALAAQDFAVASDFALVTVEDVIAAAESVQAATPPVVGLLRAALSALQAAMEE